MKRIHRSFPIHLCALTVLSGLALSVTPSSAQRQRFQGNPFATPQATPHYARSRDYHVRHLRLVFVINAKAHSAEGVVTHSLTPLQDHLRTIIMDAGANLKINACRLNGNPVPFQHEGETLTVTPPAALNTGHEVTLEIRYNMPGGGRFGGANGAGGFHWIDPRPEEPDRQVGFWTQGETDGNHHWVPCYDFPNDKCTSETIVTVPESWVVIGNGLEEPTTRDAARHTRTFRWSMNQPHSTYLLSLAGGELDVRKDTWRGVPLYYVVPRGKAGLIPTSFGNTPDMLSFFSDLLGVKYPWPKYAQDAMIDFGGGMENVSATTLGEQSLSDSRNERFAMSSLDSHELAHQWFGDLVTCKNWGDIWLNESFATLFEMLYMEHLEGKDSYDREREGNLRSYLREAERYKRPLSTHLYTNPDVMFDAHTYPKGGLILHMLRRELGDHAFFQGLNYYLRTNAYKPVDAHDLAKAFDEATGHNVDAFFDQWIYQPGHPIVDVTWTYDEAGKAVLLHVRQTQNTADGTPVYDTPVTVWLHGALGSDAARTTIHLTKVDEEFRLPVAGKPDAVLLDPDHDLLKEIKENHWSDAELPVLLRSAPCYLDRVAAAHQFVKSGIDAGKAQILQAAYGAERSDLGAAGLLDAMGEGKSEALRPLLREQLKAGNPRRRAAAATALGKLTLGAEDEALLRPLALSDTQPYVVVEGALQALGGVEMPKNLDVFRHQLQAHSQRDRLAATVVDVLNQTPQDSALPLLIAATGPTHRLNVRRSAAQALGKLSSTDKQIDTTLVTMLHENDYPQLQSAVVQALVTRKDKDAIPVLQELAASAKEDTLKRAATRAVTDLQTK